MLSGHGMATVDPTVLIPIRSKYSYMEWLIVVDFLRVVDLGDFLIRFYHRKSLEMTIKFKYPFPKHPLGVVSEDEQDFLTPILKKLSLGSGE